MSGGIAYVLDEENDLYRNLNKEMISIEKVDNKYDVQELQDMIEAHVACTRLRKGTRRFWITLRSICLNLRRSFRMITRR